MARLAWPESNDLGWKPVGQQAEKSKRASKPSRCGGEPHLFTTQIRGSR
jgi:hypothetical protein